MSQGEIPPTPPGEPGSTPPTPSLGGETPPPPSQQPTPTPPPGAAQAMNYETTGGIESNKDARLWGMLTHLTALAGFVGIPIGNILGPLVIWLVKKNEIPFADDQGKESLNFQITMTIAALISGILFCIGIGFILIIVVAILDLIFVIIASVKANNGERYRYPFAIRMIK